MSDQKIREEFEAWAITCAWLGLSDECMARDEINGGYYGLELHAAWLAWKASRVALVVELPTDTRIRDEDMSRFTVKDSCQEAIDAAGVRVQS